MRSGTPPIDSLFGGLFADLGGPGETPIPADVDDDAARALLLARLRRGPMTFQSRLVAATLAERVGVSPIAPALREVVSDASVDATARSCALLLASQGSAAATASLLLALPDAERERLDDARTALELAMLTPGFEVSQALHANLDAAPEAQRLAVFERIERCRSTARLPALLAWTRSLSDPSLAPLHGRMVAAIIDEGGRGTALAAELLCRFAPAGPAMPALMRVVASHAARGGPPARPTAVGRAHRIDRPDGSVELSACMRHPERIWFVAQLGWVGDGAPAATGVFITPGEPTIGIGGGGGGLITLSYRGATLAECLDELAARVGRVEVRPDALPWGLVVALCLLDGLAAPEAVGGDA